MRKEVRIAACEPKVDLTALEAAPCDGRELSVVVIDVEVIEPIAAEAEPKRARRRAAEVV